MEKPHEGPDAHESFPLLALSLSLLCKEISCCSLSRSINLGPQLVSLRSSNVCRVESSAMIRTDAAQYAPDCKIPPVRVHITHKYSD